MKRIEIVAWLATLTLTARVAAQVPTDVQAPGTQPGEVVNSQDSNFCNNCHGNYDAAVEPWRNWLGSAMAHATRDPLFWAATAIAEQDFPGAGDLCLRCHTPLGWLAGRSTPTDGSGLAAGDFDGVTCHLCHRLTDPDRSEHLGVQNPPFVANDEQVPATAYLGSGMFVMWPGNERIGPYSTGINPPHAFLGSQFHRSSDLCGTCHDVSNPVTGDLAHNNGAALPLAPGSFSGVPGAPVGTKAAFNNFPFQYGVVERTFSEHRATPLSSTPMSSYATLPAELQAGSIARAHASAVASTPTGNYADGTVRKFTCQACHMPPVTGKGCTSAQAPVRVDLPLHDMTGGNYWVTDAIEWLAGQGRLVGGGPLSATQKSSMNAGELRAKGNLAQAASLSVSGTTVRIVNLTGHKLISGYPEGRRMWLRTRWYGSQAQLLREDGAYGTISAQAGSQSLQVATILSPSDPNTRIYEAHMGMTQEWAAQLLALGYGPALALEYDRVTGQPAYTLGQLAAQAPGTAHESFHFALANTLVSDNRIPPWRMSYDEALARNILPVPATQYGSPGPGGEFEHWDDFDLNPPPGAAHAEIELLYQPTSWEYVQFLRLANTGASGHLATVGQDLLDAWLATGMAAPHVMATATWDSNPPLAFCTPLGPNADGCTTAISATAPPNSAHTSGCVITISDLPDLRSGIVFFSRAGAQSMSWCGPGNGNSMLCLVSPTTRTGLQDTLGGSTGCGGSLTLDWDAYQIAVGGVWSSGDKAWVQGWVRSPYDCKTTFLTEAVELTYP